MTAAYLLHFMSNVEEEAAPLWPGCSGMVLNPAGGRPAASAEKLIHTTARSVLTRRSTAQSAHHVREQLLTLKAKHLCGPGWNRTNDQGIMSPLL